MIGPWFIDLTPAPVPAPRAGPGWLDAGRDRLRTALAALGLQAAWRRGKLTEAQARLLAERVILRGRAIMRSATSRLVAGSLGIGRWFAGMAAEVSARHVAAVLGLLRVEVPEPPERLLIGQAVARQAGFLDRFWRQVVAGTRPLDGRAVNRAGLYADAAWATGHAVLTARMVRGGARQAKRILEASAHHCSACPALAALGWVRINELVPVGSTPCGPRCHCHVLFR